MMSFSRNSFQSKQSVDSSTITTSTLQLSSSTSSTSSSSSSSSESESSPIFINKVKHQSNHTSPPHSPITQPTLPPTSGEKVKIKERKKENDNKSIIILPSSYQPKFTPITIQPQLKQQPTLSTKSNIKPVEEIKDISIIFDTNYYLDCLDNIESYLKRALKIYNSKHSSLQSTASILQPYYYMIVPQQVLVELDGLKLSNNNYTATRARKASRMLVDSLAVYKNKILFLQSDSEIF